MSILFIKRYRVVIIAGVLIAVAFVGGFYIGKKDRDVVVVNKSGEPVASGSVTIRSSEVQDYLGNDVDFNLFLSVWNMVKARYVDQPVSETKLFYGALEGMVAALDDPYSVFFTPQISEEFSDSLNGKFEGIGAEIAIKHDVLTVVAPLPGSPAEKGGLQAKDVIIKIEDELTQDMRLDVAVGKIRGEKGTIVNLTIVREGENEPLEIAITRDSIHVKSVSWSMKEDGIAYISMTNFNTDTSDLFKSMQSEILAKNPKGIILDLRGNSGGFLQTSIDIASAWVGTKLVVSEKNAQNTGNKFYGSGKAVYGTIPTVVLVNAGSASASEIVSGALQDYALARIIGTQSFGKGSVQVLEDLPDGSSVKFTIARWYTPNDRSIDEEGITPDDVVELTAEDFSEDRDPQLDRAMEYLRELGE